VKRISERPDVETAHIEGRDARYRIRIRSRIRLNICNKKYDENFTSMRNASTLRCEKE